MVELRQTFEGFNNKEEVIDSYQKNINGVVEKKPLSGWLIVLTVLLVGYLVFGFIYLFLSVILNDAGRDNVAVLPLLFMVFIGITLYHEYKRNKAFKLMALVLTSLMTLGLAWFVYTGIKSVIWYYTYYPQYASKLPPLLSYLSSINLYVLVGLVCSLSFSVYLLRSKQVKETFIYPKDSVIDYLTLENLKILFTTFILSLFRKNDNNLTFEKKPTNWLIILFDLWMITYFFIYIQGFFLSFSFSLRYTYPGLIFDILMITLIILLFSYQIKKFKKFKLLGIVVSSLIIITLIVRIYFALQYEPTLYFSQQELTSFKNKIVLYNLGYILIGLFWFVYLLLSRRIKETFVN